MPMLAQAQTMRMEIAPAAHLPYTQGCGGSIGGRAKVGAGWDCEARCPVSPAPE
jgi:hypothetical protein